MVQIWSSWFHDEKLKECVQNIVLNAKARMKSEEIHSYRKEYISCWQLPEEDTHVFGQVKKKWIAHVHNRE